jgi:hypothetical protein
MVTWTKQNRTKAHQVPVGLGSEDGERSTTVIVVITRVELEIAIYKPRRNTGAMEASAAPACRART